MITPDDVADWKEEVMLSTEKILELLLKRKVPPVVALAACLWSGIELADLMGSTPEDFDFLLEGLKDKYRKRLVNK